MGKDDDHATKKPQELVARAIKHASKKGDIVLDLFGGSGSTLIAAEQSGRRAYLNELLQSYCECTIDRYINLKENNGDDVFLLRDGEKITYKEVVNEKRK
jgi:DNA modification methylase